MMRRDSALSAIGSEASEITYEPLRQSLVMHAQRPESAEGKTANRSDAAIGRCSATAAASVRRRDIGFKGVKRRGG
jgi:hypothetical protein